ncbi:MAG TPA: hypothetical protein VM287_05895 [Egibacteraceae bacterium]|jgi:hypothetical protein|nr:hypothetical protein [Egibacteraceae bacterium]
MVLPEDRLEPDAVGILVCIEVLRGHDLPVATLEGASPLVQLVLGSPERADKDKPGLLLIDAV